MFSHSDDHARTPWADDDALGSDLVTAVAQSDLYDRVLASADLAFRAHRGMVEARAGLEMDLLLLELVYDSGAVDVPAGVRDRSGGSSRTLVFEGDALSVEVEVEAASIEGQLIPPRPGHVTLRTPTGDVGSVDTDDVGYFRFDVRPDGPLRLECSNGEGACVTQWLPY
ncbi:hypothetical protein [Cellulomonas sp. URHE0023]|uniref:hypothetical protein n=1 Tax=Cellulomonas sp. URHE0023 TaxID=1380354 RepID=UPI000482B7E5|nr:hypothetical protein [Cellulomonas sp. URHE0023]